MFNVSLSGIKASQKFLDVTSNNIANANTIGFKGSRAEFADLYSSSVFSNHKTASGMGTQTTTVAQQFFQGTLSGDTGNNLDMAIQGNGFFVLSNENNPADGSNNTLDRCFTRSGAFQVNKDGYVVTAQGDFLQVWDVNAGGDAVSLDLTSTHSLRIPEDTGAPRQSSEIGIGANLPADAKALDPTHFDPKNPDTYTASTSQIIHDSLGGAHTLTYYMIKNDANAGHNNPATGENQTQWTVMAFVDGKPVDIANAGENDADQAVDITIGDRNSSIYGQGETTLKGFTMTFGPDGKLIQNGMKPTAIYINSNTNGFPGVEEGRTFPGVKEWEGCTGTLHNCMGGGVDPEQQIHINFEATQYGSSKFTINKSPTNDGYSTGLLTNVTVNEDGIIQAEYSNGRFENLGKVAMADFANPQGLAKIGDTQWKQSISSGEPTPKEPNRGGAGSIKGANLELSNVDLTSQLIDLITAQRSYQANAQSMQTQNTVMDAVLQIR